MRELFDQIQMLTGKTMSKGRLGEIMTAVDADGDNEVSWQEFARLFQHADQRNRLARRIGQKFQAELEGRGKDLIEAFKRFDTDGDGQLSQQELVEGLKQLRIRISKSEEKELMAVLDADGDGAIDFDELTDFCERAIKPWLEDSNIKQGQWELIGPASSQNFTLKFVGTQGLGAKRANQARRAFGGAVVDTVRALGRSSVPGTVRSDLSRTSSLAPQKRVGESDAGRAGTPGTEVFCN